MNKMFLTGKSIAALGVAGDVKLHKGRSLDALEKSGAVPADELKVLKRFAALTGDDWNKDRLDIAKVAVLRADPTCLKGFRADELALLPRAMGRLQYTEPVRADDFPPLPSLASEVRDVSTIPGAVNGELRVPITAAQFPGMDLEVLERLQLVHDDDGKPSTVSLADLQAGVDDKRIFTKEEREMFQAVLKDLRTKAAPPRAVVEVPEPGTRSVPIACTAPDVSLRLDAKIELTGDNAGRLEAKRTGALHIDVPAGSVVVLIHEQSGKEVVLTKAESFHVWGPLDRLSEGSYIVEVHRNGECSVGHTNVPPPPAETLDLATYAGYEFVNNDGRALSFEIVDGHNYAYGGARPSRVQWTSPGEGDRLSAEDFVRLRNGLGLRVFPLQAGLYRANPDRTVHKGLYPGAQAGKTGGELGNVDDLSLLVLSPTVAFAEFTLEKTVHRVRLRGHEGCHIDGAAFGGRVAAPPAKQTGAKGSLGEQYAAERGVLATVGAGTYGTGFEVEVDVQGRKTIVNFSEKDRVG
jgi:hypothetical protein